MLCSKTNRRCASLAHQVAALANEGHEILVVHGGGRAFTEALKRMGIESKFVSGLRVTDRETRDAAVMVFAGLLNKRLAAAISAEGYPAIGVSAADAQCFLAEPMSVGEVAGSLGFVGYLTGMNIAFIESLWRERLIPVAPCLGLGPDNELYNINADHMAAACAEFSRRRSVDLSHRRCRRSRRRKSSLRHHLRRERASGPMPRCLRRHDSQA